MRSTSDIVNANLAAYNARDLEAFMAWFDRDIEIYDLRSGTLTMRGITAVRERYAELFAASPALHSRVLQRTVLDDLVSDHELVTGRSGGDVEILITYQISNELIRRIWLARAPVAGPHVVRAAPSDVDALIELGRASYLEHFADLWSTDALGRFLDSEFDRRIVATELASSSVIYLLAVRSGLEGFAKLRLARTVPDTELPGVELQKIYVRRTAVGQRLGAQLLTAAVTEARTEHQPRIWLHVLKSNEGATRFYQRHGFRIIGDRPFVTDRGQGMWLMLRELDTDPSG
jgi:ribosomal protein S18 acetylase RimI-like enzyme